MAWVGHIGVYLSRVVSCFTNLCGGNKIREGDVRDHEHDRYGGAAWGLGSLGCASRWGCLCQDPSCRRLLLRFLRGRGGIPQIWQASERERHRIAFLESSLIRYCHSFVGCLSEAMINSFSTFLHSSAPWMVSHQLSLVQKSNTRLTLSASSRASCIPPHWYCLLMIDDIIQIGERSREFPSVDCLGGFSSILERNTKIGATSSGGLLRCDLGCCVSDLVSSKWWLVISEQRTDGTRDRRERGLWWTTIGGEQLGQKQTQWRDSFLPS